FARERWRPSLHRESMLERLTGGRKRLPELRSSDRRCEAPEGGAIKVPERWNSDRRCEAPEGGAIKVPERWNSDRRCEAPEGGAINGRATHRTIPDTPLAPSPPREAQQGAYLHVGSPSPALVTSGLVVLTPMPHEKFISWLCVFVASHAPANLAIFGMPTPEDGLNFMPFEVSVA